MPSTAYVTEDSPQATERRSMRKRSVDATDLVTTPTKRRRGSTQAVINVESSATEGGSETEGHEEHMRDDPADNPVSSADVVGTPKSTPKRRGRPPKSQSQASTPAKTPAKSIFATPVKSYDIDSTTPKRQAADRSARKKSARALIENVVGTGGSDGEEEDNDVLVREIYEDSDAEDIDEHANNLAGGVDGDIAGDATPSKTRKGRPKRAKSPTPPRDLPPHELYFAHNKPGRPKTSDNTLASLALLTHDEYFTILHEHKDRHADDIAYLENLHAESFPQWAFELSQGYSICLYGLGSKRSLLQKYAKYLHANHRGKTVRQSVIVNGYAQTTTIRDILVCIGSAINPSQRIPTSTPTVMLQSISSQLYNTDLILTIIINSIDAAPLRKPGTQAILAQLAAHPQVNLVCSADTPDFSLLWDIGVRSAFNLIFHDCTTFAPLTVELDVIDEVHELLGRTARRVNGREGVAFVLKSLPENAKNLFQLLVGEVLIAMEEEGHVLEDAAGVEYRMVYNKAVEEFICSSEMAFRTLLKEFHDHQMITSRKDALGTELLSVPFQKDELEAILEDLMS